jgi:hypothetical protein
MDLSDALSRFHLYTADQSSVEEMPLRQPAVYAFYDAFRFDKAPLVDAIDAFGTKHARTIQIDKTRLPYSLELRFRGSPRRLKGEGLRLCKRLSSPDRQDVQSALLVLSIVNEPLYIGKTDDLRKRFIGHHDSDFLFKMKNDYRRSPDEFLLLAYFTDGNRVRLLESILLQLIAPGHNSQTS